MAAVAVVRFARNYLPSGLHGKDLYVQLLNDYGYIIANHELNHDFSMMIILVLSRRYNDNSILASSRDNKHDEAAIASKIKDDNLVFYTELFDGICISGFITSMIQG